MKTSLVTGATGLLGASLCDSLLRRGDRVVVLVRDEVPFSRLNLEGDRFSSLIRARGDLLDPSVIRRILFEYEVDSVFHLGAQTLVGVANKSPAETLDVNIRGTYLALDAFRDYASQMKRKSPVFVLASSDKAYGNLDGEFYDESFPLRGQHPYDVSKSCADLIGQAYRHSYGLKVGITRCGNFFGPGDINGSRIIPGTIMSLLKGCPPVVRSDGSFVRDYIYVEDGALAYITLEEALHSRDLDSLSPAYNFSYGEKRTVLEVVSAICELIGSSEKPEIRNEVTNEIPIQLLNSELALKELEWRPKFGFIEGLRLTIDWYKRYASELRIPT